MTVRELASKYLRYFVQKKRDKESFWTIKETAPEELMDLVRTAHGDFLPDDWRYEFIRDSLIAISEADDLEDIVAEPDVYTSELLDWLSSDIRRPGYVDTATSEFGTPEPFDTTKAIALGQMYEKEEVLHLVLSELEELAEE